jgi:hypothetical protein
MVTWTEFVVWRSRTGKRFVAAMTAPYVPGESGDTACFAAIVFQRDPVSGAVSYELVCGDQDKLGEFEEIVRPRPCLPVTPTDIVWPGGPPQRKVAVAESAEPMVAATRVAELLTGVVERCACPEELPERTPRADATSSRLVASKRAARRPPHGKPTKRVARERPTSR